ncbi:MAG TPA: sulfatase-like hydrolase/transferase [Firmicutes bacterium]|nr:sulfatase [Bacillota bacterium]HHY98583.1 sulfatase-like hydrolase/transferase [Bacillota bacterium]
MNVLLISLDTTRAQSLSCYGCSKLTSPHLDALANEGAVFTECFSTHIPTHPGHTCMFTGMDVMRHQIVCQGGAKELDPAIKTLPEILSNQGYFTAAADSLGRWFSRGFQVYERYSWQKDGIVAPRKAEAVNKVALKLLEECAAQDKPWFLFVHYWDAHTPYIVPPPFDRMFYDGDETDPNNHSMDPVYACEPFRDYFLQWMFTPDPEEPGNPEKWRRWTDRGFVNALYHSAIAYMDVALCALFYKLEELKLDEKTLVVITADHGEELDEHGLWYDHHGLYDTNTRIPLILRCPGTIPAGLRLGGLVRLFDLPPTILDFLGKGDLISKYGMEGHSLVPLICGVNQAGTCDELYMTEDTWMRRRAIRTRRWLFIQEAVEGGTPEVYGRPSKELYDLVNDPGQLRNLAFDLPEVVAELEAHLMKWRDRRMRETGLPDPIEEQGITLRQITVTGPKASLSHKERPVELEDKSGRFAGYDRR